MNIYKNMTKADLASIIADGYIANAFGEQGLNPIKAKLIKGTIRIDFDGPNNPNPTVWSVDVSAISAYLSRELNRHGWSVTVWLDRVGYHDVLFIGHAMI